MKKRMLVLVCLLLVMSLLLQGCALGLSAIPFAILGANLSETEDQTEIVLPSVQRPDEYPEHTDFEDYDRDADAGLAPVSFSEMKYERPDSSALCSAFGDIQAMVESGTDAQTVIDAFEPVYEDYRYFATMSQLAYIRYTLNLNDTFYTEENEWCEEQGPLVEQAQEKCYIAMADSAIRDELESLYFEEGFFEYYDENQVYSNDRVVELMQQEADLQNQYMALQSDMTITWNGEECLVDDLLNDENLEYGDMLEIYRAYYQKYNPLAADLYIQLIRVRKQIAQELDYPSYAHFAYSYTYDRDYTPEQAADYTSSIARELSSLYYTALSGSYSADMDADTVMSKLKDTAYTFGGSIATAYDFMVAYDLYDLTESTSKMPGSYMTYLPSYEMPFMYVSPTGTIDDLLTSSHEFGHFVDGYVNCNGTTSIDCAEIFSQGLEYLTLNRAELTSYERSSLTVSKVADSLLTFLSQACYAEFEQRVFELPDSELTAENINRVFYECNEEFGMGMYGMEDILAPGWIDIQHFFIAPFYVISYCISNDAALQIFEAETEDGDGLELYNTLLANSAGNTILALMEQADMESPFDDDRAGELAEFFIDYLE